MDHHETEMIADCIELTRFPPPDEDAYKDTKGESQSTPLGQILAHLFNHQTHHRGQVHALIKEAGAEPPPLDLIYYTRVAG